MYLKQTGKILSDVEAWEMALRLINLYKLLLKDMPENPSRDGRKHALNLFD